MQNRSCLLGRITESVVEPSDAGIMVQKVWNEIPDHYQSVKLGAFVAMPNHIHAIIITIEPPNAHNHAHVHVGAGPRACPAGSMQTHEQGNHGGLPLRSLPDIIHRYKTMTTKRYADGVKNCGWTPFQGKLWQRNYYEHIIRNDADYKRIEEYINNNPRTWKDDKLWTSQ